MNKLTLLLLIGLSAAAITALQHKGVQSHSMRNQLLKAEINEMAGTTVDLERRRDARAALLEQREADLRHRRQQLAAARAVGSDAKSSAGVESENRWRDDVPYVRLAKDYLTKISVNAFVWDPANRRQLSAATAAVLGLNAEELSAANAAIDSLSQNYLQLELSHARPATPANHKEEGKASSFRISALAIDGPQLKDAFVESLKTVLGQTRTDLIMHYGRSSFWRQFADFGQSEKWITMWERTNAEAAEEIKVYVSYNNGAYSFTLPKDAEEPNAALARQLLDRARAAY
jgi:hypothetical protein